MPRLGRSLALSTAWLMLSFALASADEDSSDDERRCSSMAECCAWYGEDSQRCLRGPCSENGIMKGFFSLSMPTENVGFWDVVTTFYSMVPYLTTICILVEFVFRTRAYSRVFAVALVVLQTLITSGIMVPLIGHECAGCSRPEGTCLKSMNGMPSGHATNATGLFIWLLLESLIGVGLAHGWSLRKKLFILVPAALVFLPVAYSRYYLGDHTAAQLVVGCVDGLALASLYFLLLRWRRIKQLMDTVQRFVLRFLHVAIVDDFYTPAKMEDEPVYAPEITSADSDEGEPMQDVDSSSSTPFTKA